MDEWGFDGKLSLGKGVTALFSGPSGTGKTMAAEIIAHELGLDLYKIDLSTVVSKYIGETEKNLNRIFDAAENANAILFFDEADALFGKRSEVRDSHDRYANIEISYLLQKMDQFEGTAVLATNLMQNLDDAFVRRLTFTVSFPFPDEDSRRDIWRTIWPHQAPLDAGIRFDELARRYKLSGGSIKNVAVGAAFLAAQDGGRVTTEHITHAARREYQKIGKVMPETGAEA
jgi:SpoVK/Ycf46/Vps4 family AAA+-type ATPase